MLVIIKRYHLSFWFSIISTLFMSVIATLSFNRTGYYFYIAMLIFYLVIVFIRSFNFVYRKLNDFDDKGKPSFINPFVTGICMVLEALFFPLALIVVLFRQPVIQYTDTWIVYLFVGYAFIKIIDALVRNHRGRKNKDSIECSLGGVSLSTGIFTVFTVLVNFNAMFVNEQVMFPLEVSCIIAFSVITLAYAAYLIVLGFVNYNRVKYTF